MLNNNGSGQQHRADNDFLQAAITFFIVVVMVLVTMVVVMFMLMVVLMAVTVFVMLMHVMFMVVFMVLMALTFMLFMMMVFHNSVVFSGTKVRRMYCNLVAYLMNRGLLISDAQFVLRRYNPIMVLGAKPRQKTLE